MSVLISDLHADVISHSLSLLYQIRAYRYKNSGTVSTDKEY